MASFGSVALFHLAGVTAEDAVFAGVPPEPTVIGPQDVAAFLQRYATSGDKLDVVVFAAPQLSLFEIAALADALDGRSVHPDTTVIVATSPEIAHAADRMGLTARIEASGAIVARGICFYQSYATRDGRSQWLDSADDQLGKARQHPWRLRLPIEPGQSCAMRRLGGGRQGAVADAGCAELPSACRPVVTGAALVAAHNSPAAGENIGKFPDRGAKGPGSPQANQRLASRFRYAAEQRNCSGTRRGIAAE